MPTLRQSCWQQCTPPHPPSSTLSILTMVPSRLLNHASTRLQIPTLPIDPHMLFTISVFHRAITLWNSMDVSPVSDDLTQHRIALSFVILDLGQHAVLRNQLSRTCLCHTIREAIPLHIVGMYPTKCSLLDACQSVDHHGLAVNYWSESQGYGYQSHPQDLVCPLHPYNLRLHHQRHHLILPALNPSVLGQCPPPGEHPQHFVSNAFIQHHKPNL